MLRTAKRTPFGVQILIGLVLGVVLGLIARNAGPDGRTARRAGSPRRSRPSAAPSSRCSRRWCRRWSSSRSWRHRQPAQGDQRRPPGRPDAAVVRDHRADRGRHRHRARPGHPARRPAPASPPRPPPARSTTGSWLDFLTGLVPANVLGLERRADGDGCASSCRSTCCRSSWSPSPSASPRSRSARRPSRSSPSAESVLAVVQKVLWWVIRLAPIGTVGLHRQRRRHVRLGRARPLGTFTVAVYVGLRAGAVRRLPAAARDGRTASRSAVLLAAPGPRSSWPSSRRSSVGTMPVTERVTERNLGVPREYASFAVPFGATTKMDGCAAIYPAHRGDLRRAVLRRRRSVTDYLLIAFVSVDRLGRHRRPHRRDRDAHPDPVDAGPAARGRRPAARDRPDPRHGPHRGQRRRPGAGARRSSPSARASSTSTGSTLRGACSPTTTRPRPPSASSLGPATLSTSPAAANRSAPAADRAHESAASIAR